MSDWTDVLTSTLGGGVLAMLAWLVLARPCHELPVSGLTIDCVRFAGGEYSFGEVMFFVPLMAMGIGFLIHVIHAK